jgi:CrcB protein
MLKILLIIGTGSFLGGVSRFLTSRYIQNNFISAFPYGTFVVNILGCFLIGLIYGLSEKGNIISAEWRMFLTVGFCGGFTTFSTFANENISLLRDGDFFYFALYTGLSVFLGLMAVYFGNLIIKII